MTRRDEIIPEWIGGEGPESDIAISTRARLARSLAAIPFPSRASREDLTMVAQKIRAASVGLMGRYPDLKAVSVSKLSQEQKSFLLDAHVVSVEQVRGGDGREVILEPTASLAIMVNEEDHLRIQSVKPGLAPEEAWETVDWADDVLAAGLEYGYSERYGFLTASVSNVGTGLRVSVMMHLAGLAMKKSLARQLRAAYELGVSVRGMFGEGTRSAGDLFQVSNEATLGIGEREIVGKVRSVAEYLLCEERQARKELMSQGAGRVVGEARNALNALQSSMSMRPEQAISLLSPIRLAAGIGLADNCRVSLLNELLVGMQVTAADEGRASIERASMLRDRLAGVHIQAP